MFVSLAASGFLKCAHTLTGTKEGKKLFAYNQTFFLVFFIFIPLLLLLSFWRRTFDRRQARFSLPAARSSCAGSKSSGAGRDFRCFSHFMRRRNSVARLPFAAKEKPRESPRLEQMFSSAPRRVETRRAKRTRNFSKPVCVQIRVSICSSVCLLDPSDVVCGGHKRLFCKCLFV